MKADPARHVTATYPWQLDLATRYADMDANGHLNNVAIARLFEETRVQFNWDSGRIFGSLANRPRFLVAHVAIDYLAEGNYPAPVTMGYGIASIGTSSFRVGMACFQQGRCIALSDSVLVHRGGDGGPAPLPPALRERLEAFRLTV